MSKPTSQELSRASPEFELCILFSELLLELSELKAPELHSFQFLDLSL